MIVPLNAKMPRGWFPTGHLGMFNPLADGSNSISTGSARVVILRAYCKTAARLLHEGSGDDEHPM